MRIWRRLLAVAVLALVIAGGAAQAADRATRGFRGGIVETPVPKFLDPGPVAPNVWDLSRHRGGFVGALADLTSRQDVFALVRYRHNGTLDRGFGDDGFARPLPLQAAAQAQGVAVAPDGGIVVAGFSQGRRRIPLIVRYRAEGSLDRSFGNKGIVSLRQDGGAPHDVAIEPSGRIVVAGADRERGIGLNGPRSGGFVAAYLPDGQVDTSFGRAGRVDFDLPRPTGSYSGLKSIVTLSDGRLLASGFQDGDPFMARLLQRRPTWTPSFGSGKGTVAFSLLPPSACYDIL